MTTITDATLKLTQTCTNVCREHIDVIAKCSQTGRTVLPDPIPHTDDATAPHVPRQCGLSVSSDAKSDEHMQRHSRGWSSSSRSSFVASSTSSLSSVQASAESSASSSPSCHHTRHARRCSHRHLRRHYWYHHYHRCYGYSHRESHTPMPFVSCAPPPHNRIISKIR